MSDNCVTENGDREPIRVPEESGIHGNQTQSSSELDYEKIIHKLHKLANEDSPRDQTDDLLSLEKSPVHSKINGLTGLKTPANTPENNSVQYSCEVDDAEVRDPVVLSEDEFGISYVRYQSELQMSDIMSLISKDLSEPYSIYTYRYFIHNWPHLCFLAMDGDETVGAIVCKIDPHKRTMRSRGYIAMLAVDISHRRKKIGSNLVRIAIEAMIQNEADEIVLETEVTNLSALNLYEKLGFVRDKRLYKYYLNGVDAFRLKLWLT